jgi:hypothetical protein
MATPLLLSPRPKPASPLRLERRWCTPAWRSEVADSAALLLRSSTLEASR